MQARRVRASKKASLTAADEQLTAGRDVKTPTSTALAKAISNYPTQPAQDAKPQVAAGSPIPRKVASPAEQPVPKNMKQCNLCAKRFSTHAFPRKRHNRPEGLCTGCMTIMDDVYATFGQGIVIEQLREPVQNGTLDEFLAAARSDGITRFDTSPVWFKALLNYVNTANCVTR